METMMLECMAEGDRAAPTRGEDGWAAHPRFAGVTLKRLVEGATTGGTLTTLMVRISPNCTMAAHRHDGEIEQHFVVAGSGRAEVDGRSVDYSPGALMVIPRAREHAVAAGADGLVLMAVFVPAVG